MPLTASNFNFGIDTWVKCHIVNKLSKTHSSWDCGWIEKRKIEKYFHSNIQRQIDLRPHHSMTNLVNHSPSHIFINPMFYKPAPKRSCKISIEEGTLGSYHWDFKKHGCLTGESHFGGLQPEDSNENISKITKKNYSILLISPRLCSLDKTLVDVSRFAKQRAESRAEAEIESEIALWNLRRGRRC